MQPDGTAWLALRSFSCVVDVEEVSSIMVDSSVLAIVVSEALSNARKYRDPTKPIIVRARFGMLTIGHWE